MPTLATLFGTSELSVVIGELSVERAYRSYSGVNGVVDMLMGTRGRHIIVTGRLANATYAGVQSLIAAIESSLTTAATTYTHISASFANTLLERLELLPDSSGRTIRPTTTGYVCLFRATMRSLT